MNTNNDFIQFDGLPNAIRVGGLPITRLSRTQFCDLLVKDWQKQKNSGNQLRPKISFSANGQIIAEVNRSTAMLDVFNRADYIDADGMWVVFASKLLSRRKLTERVATTDFFHDVAETAVLHGMSIFILGSTPTNNEMACKKIQKKYPNLKIAGAHHGFFKEESEAMIIDKIKEAQPDVLWIAMGFPRQELFADKNADKLRGVTWIKTCGGLLEHILEIHPRSPLWIQNMGFEWLYRMLQEPRRLGVRYLKTNPLAIWNLLTKTDRH